MALSPSEVPIPPSPTSSATSSYSETLIDQRSPVDEKSGPGVSLGPKTWPGSNPLVHAILGANVAQVRSLAQKGYTITAPDGWALYEACIRGPEMVQALMLNPDVDFDQEIPGNDGRTLHYVLRTPADEFVGNKIDVVQLLLLSGVDPFQRDALGDTALHLLAGPVYRAEADTPSSGTSVSILGQLEAESLDLLRYLLARMHNHARPNNQEKLIDIVNDYGNTALVVAVLYNNLEAIRLLLDNGADSQIRGEVDL